MLNRNKTLEDKIKNIVEQEGAELIDFKVFVASGKHILRCIIDYPTGGITMGDCAKINRKVFSYLEESSALGEDYTVEINSPGLDRQLKKYQDFLKVKGKVISLWLNEPVCQKQYLEGRVEGVDESKLSLSYKGQILEIDFSKIKLGKEKIEIK